MRRGPNGNRALGPTGEIGFADATGSPATAPRRTRTAREGELQTKTDGGQTTTHTCDVRGSLTHVDWRGGTAIGCVVDGVGRRAGKRIDGVLVQGFLDRDEAHTVAELDGEQRRRRYVRLRDPERTSPRLVVDVDKRKTPR